jgi:DNA-binding response OmpR family regulator
MSKMPCLIIVDNRIEAREAIRVYMERNGYEVQVAPNTCHLGASQDNWRCDLVILTLGQHLRADVSIVARLTAVSRVPVIVLNDSGDASDRAAGLEMGADDFMSGPIDLRELLARVRSVLRRSEVERPEAVPDLAKNRLLSISPASLPDATGQILPLGAVSLDVSRCKVIGHDGQETKLTVMERDLLKVFARNPNRVLSRQILLDLAHCRDEEPFDRSIDIRITRIRRKIEADPAKPQLIRTVRGSGYMFVPPSSAGQEVLVHHRH